MIKKPRSPSPCEIMSCALQHHRMSPGAPEPAEPQLRRRSDRTRLGPADTRSPAAPGRPPPAAQFPFSSPRRGGGTWLCPEAVGEPLRCPVTPLPLPALCVTAGRRRRRAADARSRAGGCRGCGVYLSAWLPGKNKKIKKKIKKGKKQQKNNKTKTGKRNKSPSKK